MKLAEIHNDIIWDGGEKYTNTLRVSLKDKQGRNFAAINTRKRNHILRIEFRSRDYQGLVTVLTSHKNFNRGFDINGITNLEDVSEIITNIKKNYSI